MKRCISLIRVSTESQAGIDRASIPAQKAINSKTAQAYGLTIVRSIEMSDVSGAAVLLTPEIQELLILMNDPEIHGVIAREFSRLMRPEKFTDYALLQTFADTKTFLYLPEGPIDFASKTGRLMGTIRAAMAGMERTEILERIWSAKEEKRRSGGFGQAYICLPFGVDYKGKWLYTPDAERVREAFRLFLAGETSYSELESKVGIKAFNLRNILRNPIYTGWRVINKRADMTPAGKYKTKDGRQGGRRLISRAPEDVIRVKVLDPIVSESEFAQVQRIIEMKKTHHWRRHEHEQVFVYRGLLSCSMCEGLIYTKHTGGTKDGHYVCKRKQIGQTCKSTYMRRDVLEAKLDSLLSDNLTRPIYLRQIEKSMKASRPEPDSGRLLTQVQALTGKRERVLESYYAGVISPAERNHKLSEIEREKGIVSELLNRQQPTGIDANALAQVFKVFLRFKRLNVEQKRRLLVTIAPEILVANYEIKGMYCGGQMNHTDMIYGATTRFYLPLAA